MITCNIGVKNESFVDNEPYFEKVHKNLGNQIEERKEVSLWMYGSDLSEFILMDLQRQTRTP